MGSPHDPAIAVQQDVGDLLRHAISCASEGSVAENLAATALNFRQGKLASCSLHEELWKPAMEFLAIMGWGPAKVFRGVFAVFGGALTDRLDCGQRAILERILPEMLRYRKSPGMFCLIAVAMERLGNLPKPVVAPSCVEEDAFRILADLPNSDAEKLPHALRQRLLARDLPRFYEKLEPILSRAVEWLRYKLGPSMMLEGAQAKASGDSSALRSGFAAIDELAELIGHSHELFDATRAFIKKKADAGFAGEEPILRRFQLKDETSGAPVSIGHEPFLSTVQSQLLLTLVDRKVLTPTIRGTWKIESIVEGKPKKYEYALHIIQYGDRFDGTSTLNNRGVKVRGKITWVKQAEASVDSMHLTFEQGVYHCSCCVSHDLQELRMGKWRDSRSQTQGSFSGQRVGAPCYADRRGEIWDQSLHFVALCDSMHGLNEGLNDSLLEMMRRFATDQVASGIGTQAMACMESVVADTNVVQSLLFSLMYSRNHGNKPVNEPMSEKERFMILLLLYLAQFEPSHAPFPKDLLEQLKEGPPSEESLNKAGLRCDRLAKSLRYCFLASSETETEGGLSLAQPQGSISAHLDIALRAASNELPRSAAAFNVVRLVCSFMANFAILSRKASVLQEVLSTVRSVVDAQNSKRPDWITRQLVDILVNSGIHLERGFDADLRKVVLEYLMPLAKVDAWVHFRVAEMLKTAFTVGISMAREQIMVLSVLLPDGLRKDSHYDWTRRLAMAYASIVKVRIHLQDQFESSDLGKLATEYSASMSDVKDAQGMANEDAGAESNAPVQPSSNVSEANCDTETGACSVASRSTVAASGHEDLWADGTPASNQSSPGNARRRIWLREWAQAILETQDGVLSPSIDKAVKEFCGNNTGDERELASKAADLLQANYVGSDSLCADAAKWYIMLEKDASEGQHVQDDLGDRIDKGRYSLKHYGDAHQLLLRCLLETMEDAFDMNKADSVWEKDSIMFSLDVFKDFCSAFIRVPEFRQLIYKLCAPMRSQASNFLSYMLFRITNSTSVRDGLQEVMAKHVFAIHRSVFDFALQDKIRSLFQVMAETGHPIGPSRISDYALGPALEELCKVCNFSESTYFYSQALLAGMAAAHKSSRHIFRYMSEAVSRTMPSKKSKTGVWLSDMRFRGLGRHRELFEILAAMYSSTTGISNEGASHTFSRPKLSLTTCAPPAQRLHCEVSPKAVKSICSLLEELLCPDAKEMWKRVAAEASSNARDTLCDASGFWQSGAYFKPIATKAMMDWTLLNLDRQEQERVALEENGWILETPKVEAKVQPMDDWTHLPGSPLPAERYFPGSPLSRFPASSPPEDDDPCLDREAMDCDSDGARTEAALDDDWGELDEGVEEAVLAAEISRTGDWELDEGVEQAVPAAEISRTRDWDAGRSEEVQSHASSTRRRGGTLCARMSEPSSFTESGYKMHAVSSRSMGSVSTNEVRAGQDFEEIGAQSVLEFFRSPTFLEGLVRAFFKVGHQKNTRSSFVKLLALISADGLLEEEGSEEELHRSGFLAQMAVRELLAINRLCHLETEHRRGIGCAWFFRLHFMMHFQSTAIASFAGLVWMREDFLAQAVPYCELLERLSSNLPLVFLESALQNHPQQGEEVLTVLMHMLQILAKKLHPEDAGIPVESDDQNRMDDVNLSASWEKSEAELEDVRENIRFRIASMLVHLIASYQLALPILDFLEDALSTLRPRALKFFVVEMLGVIRLPAPERVTWAIARLLAHPEVGTLLEGDGSADICTAVLQFTEASEALLQWQKSPDENVLSRVRSETKQRVKELRIKLRDVLNRKSCSASMPIPAAPVKTQGVPSAQKELSLASWFWKQGKSRFAKSSRAAKKDSRSCQAKPKHKASRSTNRGRRASKRQRCISSEEDLDDAIDNSEDGDEHDEDDESEYDFEADSRQKSVASHVRSDRESKQATVNRKKHAEASSKKRASSSNNFGLKFAGRWKIQNLRDFEQNTGKIIGHVSIEGSSSSCQFDFRSKPTEISGQGTKAKPFVIEKGGEWEAHLEIAESQKLVWKFVRKNKKTVWTREETESPSAPPTPPTPTQARRSNTPERSEIGGESVTATLDDVTVVSSGTPAASQAEEQGQKRQPKKKHRLKIRSSDIPRVVSESSLSGISSAPIGSAADVLPSTAKKRRTSLDE